MKIIKQKNKIQEIITYKIPDNVYVIEKTLLNNVVYGDSKDDLENMIFQSHPKWFLQISWIMNQLVIMPI